VKVSAPPILDSFYAYVPKTAPRVNTVFHTPTRPSGPALPSQPVPALGAKLPRGAQEAVRCVSNPNGEVSEAAARAAGSR
jgi:hypothetical protein